MNWLHVLVALVSAIVGGSGVGFWAYVIARRTTSGSVANTSAESIFKVAQEENTEHRIRLAQRVEALERDAARKDEAMRIVEKRLLDCERDRAEQAAEITIIKADRSAATIIEAAIVEAAKIRQEAAEAKAAIVAAAEVAAGVVSDTATTTASELAKPPHGEP